MTEIVVPSPTETDKRCLFPEFRLAESSFQCPLELGFGRAGQEAMEEFQVAQADFFSAAESAASSVSESSATPSVRKAVVTFSCKLGEVVAFFVGGWHVGVDGRVAACGFFIVGTFAQQGLIVRRV